MKTLSILLGGWLLFFQIHSVSAENKSKPPNILLIAVDDLRPMLGCYGDPDIKTPHIDQLAARGMLFEKAYCQYAKCGTSRLSFMTGLRPDSIDVFSNNFREVKAFRKRRPDLQSMGQWFKENGYHTQSFGKIYHDGWDNTKDWSEPSSPGREREMWEVVAESKPEAPTIIAERLDCPVMQQPDVADEHLFAGRMTRQVVSLLDNTFGKPFFLAVGYRRPHLPFVAPKKYYDLYQPDHTWLPQNPEPPANTWPVAWFNSDGYIGSAKRVGLTMPKPPNRKEAIEWNGYEMRSYRGVPNHGSIEPKLQIELRHAYAACISYVDTQIGKVLEALRKSGQDKNTIIVFLSDHGWHLGEHSAWGKMTNYEVATRVPLIFSGPGVNIGRRTDFAELVDIYSTLCDLAEIEPPDHLEGQSLIGSEKTYALSQYSRYGRTYTGRSIRTGEYRYIAWYDNDRNIVEEEYYDHRTDPGEQKNITDKVAGLKAVREQMMKAFGK